MRAGAGSLLSGLVRGDLLSQFCLKGFKTLIHAPECLVFQANRSFETLQLDFNFCNGSWSPQGNEILLSAHQPNFDYHSSIWVIHANGTGLRRIPVPDCGGLNADPNGVGCPSPSWSPDGRKIVFSRQVDSQPHDIYTVNADGSGLLQVTNTPDITEFSAEGVSTR
jgi:Tol biopolymer transport system component